MLVRLGMFCFAQKVLEYLRCIKDWVGHKRDIYNRNFNLLLFTVYITLCNTFVMK